MKFLADIEVEQGADTTFVDNAKALFGTSGDLEIYHDGSNSYIADVGTGDLTIRSSNDLRLQAASTEAYLTCNENGSVQIYYNNTEKFATSSTGINITGGWVTDGVSVATANIEHTDNSKALFGDGNDMQIYHDGSNSYVRDVGTGRLWIDSNGEGVSIISDGSGSTAMAHFYKDAAVELYYNNVKRIETTSVGATLTGDLTVSGGDITLGGTGRIQGVDTVSASTDAANKAYVDAVNVGVTQITAGTNITISPSGGTGNVTINASGGGGSGTIGGTIAATQVAFGDTTDDEINGVSTFTYSDSGGIEALSLGDATNGIQTNFNLSHPNTGSTRARYNLYAGTGANSLKGYLQSANTGGEVTLLSNANLVLECGSTYDITMASSSSSGVGIGTTSPSKKLTVNGTIYSEQASGEVMIAGDSSYASKYITIREGANYAARWGLQAVDDIVTSGVALMSSAKPIAFRASTNIAFDSISLSHLIIRPATTNGSANVGMGTDDPQSKLQVAGGIQMADDSAADNIAAKAGTLRYREVTNIGTPKASNSYIDMYMRTGDSSYEWVNIVTSNW